jgi:hypothetical protein
MVGGSVFLLFVVLRPRLWWVMQKHGDLSNRTINNRLLAVALEVLDSLDVVSLALFQTARSSAAQALRLHRLYRLFNL